MIVKWIRCSVEEAMHEAFSNAQKGWAELATVPGFVIQLGGWDSNDSGRACIMGIWQDSSAYDAFMNNQHDKISDRNDQASTYSSIETRTYCSQFEIPGTENELVKALAIAPVLRFELFHLSPGQEKRFEDLQLGNQLPQMRAAGLIMGLVSKQPDAAEYLVTTLWRDEQAKDFVFESESSNVDRSIVNLVDVWRVEAK